MSTSDELRELRESLARANRELSAAAEHLEALESRATGSATVVIPRWRRRDGMVAAGASIGTALLMGIAFVAWPESKPEPAAPLVATVTPKAPEPPVRPDPIPPPEPVIVAKPPEPPPPPVVVEPPPVRVRHVAPASTPDMGSLTIVCLPVKCDSIIDNAVPLGPGHIFGKPVAAGRHHLQLHAPNGESKGITVDVLPNQLKDVRVVLAPEGPPNPYGNASDVF